MTRPNGTVRSTGEAQSQPGVLNAYAIELRDLDDPVQGHFDVGDVPHPVGVGQRRRQGQGCGAFFGLRDVEQEHDRSLRLQHHQGLFVGPDDAPVSLTPGVAGQDVTGRWSLQEDEQGVVRAVLVEGRYPVQ
jgi:hypothetical protein